jgi:predicted ArsR family transcriptional regulator
MTPLSPSRAAPDPLSLLADPVRRTIYSHVARSPEALSRDAVAAAAGVNRALAAFHLERLLEAGLLIAEYRRLSGRTGPGAGRPSKLYRRSNVEVDLAIPPRRYRDLAARLAAALADEDPSSAPVARLRERAYQDGAAVGSAARDKIRGRKTTRNLLKAASETLTEAGFAGNVEADGRLCMSNCPFDAVARVERALVCGELNRSFMTGVAAALDPDHVEAVFEPAEERCCMVLQPV